MKRVVLKSPVRENCTPGSVRGAPGNRRPYLDNHNPIDIPTRWPVKFNIFFNIFRESLNPGFGRCG
jgi:hypothetical protein